MKKILSTILLLSIYIIGFTQGCSDAGVCTFSKESAFDTVPAQNSFAIGYVYGKGLEDVYYHGATLDYSRRVSARFSFGARFTYSQAHGNFGINGKPGDAFLIAAFSPETKRTAKWKFVSAVKAPLSTANNKINGIPLPMDYQSSLGTVDVLLNAVVSIKKWKFDAAFQLPVIQSNRNSFFDEYSASDVFPTTNLFVRKPDALIRSAYAWQSANKKWEFEPSAMAIYHLGNDQYTDVFGDVKEIENSEGLTVNIFLSTRYKLNERSKLEIGAATPLVVREVRPDGLTRAFVGTLSYQVMF